MAYCKAVICRKITISDKFSFEFCSNNPTQHFTISFISTTTEMEIKVVNSDIGLQAFRDDSFWYCPLPVKTKVELPYFLETRHFKITVTGSNLFRFTLSEKVSSCQILLECEVVEMEGNTVVNSCKAQCRLQ